MWRYHDHPMTGTIFRLPDDTRLQRGMTYTFLPDGKQMRVPAMNRLDVRAAAQGHQENEDGDIMKALQRLMSGKKKENQPQPGPGLRRDMHSEGIRPVPINVN